jgi:hypothetical protein
MLLVVLPEPLVELTPKVGEIVQVMFPPEPPDTELVTEPPAVIDVDELQLNSVGAEHGTLLTVIVRVQLTLACGVQPAGEALLVLVNVTV